MCVCVCVCVLCGSKQTAKVRETQRDREREINCLHNIPCRFVIKSSGNVSIWIVLYLYSVDMPLGKLSIPHTQKPREGSP